MELSFLFDSVYFMENAEAIFRFLLDAKMHHPLRQCISVTQFGLAIQVAKLFQFLTYLVRFQVQDF